MKKIYYLLIVVLVSLVSCVDLDGDLGPGMCENDVYFYNELDKDITLRIFDGRKVKKYKLKQNEPVYFTTVVYYNEPGLFVFPGGPAYDRTISSIDSVKVTYNKNVYTYYHPGSDLYDGMGWFLNCSMPTEDWMIYFNEHLKEHFGWE